MKVRRELIRWTVMLCAGLFSAMLILGQDRGQQRLGLSQQPKIAVIRPAPEVTLAVLAKPLAHTRVSLTFAPAKPLIASPETEPATAASASQTAPALMYVDARHANLRHQSPNPENEARVD